MFTVAPSAQVLCVGDQPGSTHCSLLVKAGQFGGLKWSSKGCFTVTAHPLLSLYAEA